MKFWGLVDSSRGKDACWLFRGNLNDKGYGRYGRARHLAHRVAFLAANGYLPPVVMHKCDQPACCNPKHLKAGTVPENNADMWRKGRGVAPRICGERNPAAKLSVQEVVELRSLRDYLTQREAAHLFDVSQVTVGNIWRGDYR